MMCEGCILYGNKYDGFEKVVRKEEKREELEYRYSPLYYRLRGFRHGYARYW